MTELLIHAEGIVKDFHVGGGLLGGRARLRALDGVDLEVRRGEILALVGESGSGKSTLGRCLLGLTRPSSGRILFDGANLAELSRSELRRFRRRAQPVFQDPYSSLDPRWTVERTIREPLDAFEVGTPVDRRACVRELMEAVGLSARHARSRPHELSGGQRQRVVIAAALALDPDLLVADEPVSALDVLVQAQILNLIAQLHDQLGLTIVFITHDLAVVDHLAVRVAVMYLGRIVETGRTEAVLRQPRHPYTHALMSAIPQPDPAKPLPPAAVRGEIPSPIDPPSGCHFHLRCPLAIEVCRSLVPPLITDGAGHAAACHVANAQPTTPQHV